MNDFIDSLGLVQGEGAFYEDWRQEELTMALGQVQCTGIGAGHSRGAVEYGLDCAFCGAQV